MKHKIGVNFLAALAVPVLHTVIFLHDDKLRFYLYVSWGIPLYKVSHHCRWNEIFASAHHPPEWHKSTLQLYGVFHTTAVVNHGSLSEVWLCLASQARPFSYRSNTVLGKCNFIYVLTFHTLLEELKQLSTFHISSPMFSMIWCSMSWKGDKMRPDLVWLLDKFF